MARRWIIVALFPVVFMTAAEVHPHLLTNYSTTELDHPDVSPRLLYGETHGVSWSDLRLDHRLSPLVTRVYLDVTGLDYHYHRRWLFYSGLGQIWRLSMNQEEEKSDPKLIVSDAGGATSVAVDWVEDRVYWLSPGTRTVRRSDLRGAGQEVVLGAVNISRPDVLVLDPHSRLMFVTLNVKGGVVLRAGLQDAALSRVTLHLVGESLQEVVSLAVDVRHRTLFLSARQDFLPVILSCDYGGRSVRRHDLSERWWHQVTALAALGDRLFWVHHDWPGATPEVDSVWKTDSSGGWIMEYRAQGKLLDPTNRIWAVKVYHPDVQGPPIVSEDERSTEDASPLTSSGPGRRIYIQSLLTIVCVIYNINFRVV